MRTSNAAMTDSGAASSKSKVEHTVRQLDRLTETLAKTGKTAEKTAKAIAQAGKVTQAVRTLLNFDEINRLVEKTVSAAKTTTDTAKTKTGETSSVGYSLERVKGLKEFTGRFWTQIGTTTDSEQSDSVSSRNHFQRSWDVAKPFLEQVEEAFQQLMSWRDMPTLEQGLQLGFSLVTTPAQLWAEFLSGWNSGGEKRVSIGNLLASTAGTLWKGFSSSWGTRTVSVKNVLASAAGVLWKSFSSAWGSRTVSVKNVLTNTASSLWEKFKAGWSGKTLGLKLTYTTAVGAIKTAVYKALGLEGWPKLSFAARGGVFSGPTLTMLGEAGTEAVVPLEHNTGWLDQVAQRLGEHMGGVNGDITIPIYIGGEKIAQPVVRAINAVTRRTGVSPLYV